jgi:hypothetical protein
MTPGHESSAGDEPSLDDEASFDHEAGFRPPPNFWFEEPRYEEVLERPVRFKPHHDPFGPHLLPPMTSDPEFEKRFETEEACSDFLFRCRWPEGFRCRRCGGGAYRWLDTRRLLCLGCRRKNSLTAGTILHGTRKPLRSWFRAAFLVVQRGANARMLQRDLKLTYKIAWLWAHKLHELMKLETRLPEANPPYAPRSITNRSPQAERTWGMLHGRFEWTVEGRNLDGCCRRLDRADWNEPPPVAGVETGRRHLFRALSGSVSEKHLRSYMAETAFRMNHAKLAPGNVAVELMSRFARTEPLSYGDLRGKRPAREPLLFRPAYEIAPTRHSSAAEHGDPAPL